MHKLASIAAALALLPMGAGSAPAIAVFPPEIVGPQTLWSGTCPIKMTEPGGTTPGAEIPVAALHLGAPVDRNATSFPTGGSGTAKASERWRRKQAGLQYDPITFDPAGTKKPSVFAVERSQLAMAGIYQHFPLKSDGTAYSPNGMIFAQATTRTTGRIVSLALLLPKKPAAAPRLTVTGAQPMPEGCKPDNPIDVYAPAMTAPQLRRLFGTSGCGWRRIGSCAAAERPRGRVLFVQKQQGTSYYEYRWVDYDMVASFRPGKATSR